MLQLIQQTTDTIITPLGDIVGRITLEQSYFISCATLSGYTTRQDTMLKCLEYYSKHDCNNDEMND